MHCLLRKNILAKGLPEILTVMTLLAKSLGNKANVSQVVSKYVCYLATNQVYRLINSTISDSKDLPLLGLTMPLFKASSR